MTHLEAFERHVMMIAIGFCTQRRNVLHDDRVGTIQNPTNTIPLRMDRLNLPALETQVQRKEDADFVLAFN